MRALIKLFTQFVLVDNFLSIYFILISGYLHCFVVTCFTYCFSMRILLSLFKRISNLHIWWHSTCGYLSCCSFFRWSIKEPSQFFTYEDVSMLPLDHIQRTHVILLDLQMFHMAWRQSNYFILKIKLQFFVKIMGLIPFDVITPSKD